ncbi:hypothetical protein M8494_22135 [Serratia ureilytica]
MAGSWGVQVFAPGGVAPEVTMTMRWPAARVCCAHWRTNLDVWARFVTQRSAGQHAGAHSQPMSGCRS